MTLKAFIFAATAMLPSIGMADTITLEAPYHAASLHDGDVDMVVYYVDHADHFEVVATYVSKTDLASPSRLRMGLIDGDTTSFALPGLTHVTYDFSRKADAVSVTARDGRDEVASAKID